MQAILVWLVSPQLNLANVDDSDPDPKEQDLVCVYIFIHFNGRYLSSWLWPADAYDPAGWYFPSWLWLAAAYDPAGW